MYLMCLLQPFNHPLFIAVKKIAPALAAGNSVIVKPSELAPVSVLEFAEMAEEAGCALYIIYHAPLADGIFQYRRGFSLFFLVTERRPARNLYQTQLFAK